MHFQRKALFAHSCPIGLELVQGRQQPHSGHLVYRGWHGAPWLRRAWPRLSRIPVLAECQAHTVSRVAAVCRPKRPRAWRRTAGPSGLAHRGGLSALAASRVAVGCWPKPVPRAGSPPGTSGPNSPINRTNRSSDRRLTARRPASSDHFGRFSSSDHFSSF